MTSVEKKLLSLNLALLFLFLCAQPAFAAGAERTDELLQSEASVAMGETLKRNEQNEVATQSVSEDDSYYISVGDTYFQSNKDISGEGWTYVAELHELFLNGYRGRGISASGDLSIYVSDDTTIEGYNNTYYGGDGISVAGRLILTLFEDSHLKVTGGSGSERGGDALYGSDIVAIFGSGSYETAGGISRSGTGGCGVYSDSIYIDASGVLQGGAGAYGGAGVFFKTSCEFDAVNATIRGGKGSYGYAIQSSQTGATWYYSIHTNITKTPYEVRLAIKQYTLALYGNGGHRSDDRTVEELTDYYPKYYDLIEHRFYKDGYEQVGWREGTNILPLSDVFCPTTNTDLYAYWESVEPKDILLQGLDGYFDNGKTYQKYTGLDVTLPKQLDYSHEFYNTNLLAWSDQLQASALDLYVYDGTWYCGGDTVEADTDAAKVLYAYPQSGAGTAIYHPTKGTVKKGGTVIVQGRYSGIASPMDLQTYTIGADYLTAPEDYKLAGWSTSPEAQRVDYELGDELQVDGGTVQHLYAVWKRMKYHQTPDTGCTVTTIPAEEKVEVTLDKTWCDERKVNQGFCALYDENGKLISVSFGRQDSDQSITLEMQYTGETAKTCKVFGVKDQNIPAGSAIQCELTEIK